MSRTEIAERLGVRPATIGKWTRLKLFPEPVERISNRVLLYEKRAVERAIAAMTARTT
ncbi:MAG: hypothetical protein WC538_00280 [Thermoanaerobaculia bacterium]